VTDWLTRQGFQVAKVAAGRGAIEFNGTVAQVRNAFHTEIHKFSVNGEERIANVSEPAIPAALAPVVKGVAAMNTFRGARTRTTKESIAGSGTRRDQAALYFRHQPREFCDGAG